VQGASVVKTRLEALATRAWNLFETASARAPEVVVRPSVPILYFGDSEAYARAPLKVVTVGLNPSWREFPPGDPWLRFPRARVNGSIPALGEYLEALNEYFRTAPYRDWFDLGFEPILRGLGASYYSGAALHTDIGSPVATDPTWSRLGQRRQLLGDGASLWRDLVDVLRPDVVLISVARDHLRHVSTLPPSSWRVAYTVERENPFEVRSAQAEIGGSGVPIYFGRCVNKPFGSVSTPDKERIGRAIREELRGN
jgi:hypothetical protein